MQEHYRFADGVSEDEANLIFNNATRKVIKDVFKNARCISVASYYTQVNLLPFCTHVLNLLIFTLTCKCNSFLHAGVEAGDEADPGPQGLSNQGPPPSGGLIGWLRIKMPGAGSVTTGHPMSLESCWTGTVRTGRASPR
jgi:hypothetical protein